MDFDPQWFLLALPLAFALGWLGSRLDLRQHRREQRDAPRAYFKGLNLLLNEQHDKAIDVFIEAVQQDPDTSDLHFALGNLFRRRGEYERAVRVHEHLLQRADLPRTERERAQHALAQDFMKAGLFDRAEQAYRALDGTAFATDAQLALLALYERSRQWRQAIDTARKLEHSGLGSFATRMAHHWCELAIEADAQGQRDAADTALAEARKAAPLAPRPLSLAGEIAATRGEAAAAMASWNELMNLHPQAFSLVATRYAQQARAAGPSAPALARLLDAYQREPGIDLLHAVAVLDTDGSAVRERLRSHLRDQPTLGAALQVLRAPPSAGDLTGDDLQRLTDAMAKAARPLQRYRCAACGFEAQQYFWQCPGCLGWDTFPPRRLEEM
jgi:lipopolysaccharide assembly protein B